MTAALSRSLLAVPPSATRTRWADLSRELRPQELEERICGVTGGKAAFFYVSWAGALHDILANCRAAKPEAREVVLPRYCCETYVKAVKAAGLVPAFYDLDTTLMADLDAVAKCIDPQTLAIVAINNACVFSDLPAIRELCDRNQLFMVETATYTLGARYGGSQPSGSIGDAAILNFSEGKALPVGGGGAVLNAPELISSFERSASDAGTLSSKGGLRRRAEGVAYKLGTSRLGYTAFHLTKVLRGLAASSDSTGRITFEPVRRGGFSAAFFAELSDPQRQRACAYLERMEAERAHRNHIAAVYEEALADAPELLVPAASQHAHDNHWIRFPVFSEKSLPADFGAFHRRGLSRLYGPTSPLNDDSYPSSHLLYERLFTLPTHHLVDEAFARSLARDILEAL